MDDDEAGDSVSLPPSVAETDDEALQQQQDDEDDVSLPPEVVEDGFPEEAQCCKRRNCKSLFDRAVLETYQAEFSHCSQAVRLNKAYEKVRDVFKAGGSDTKKPMPWALLGKPVCRKFFETIHQVGHGTMDQMVLHCKNGHTSWPQQRGPRLQRDAPATDTVDVWFMTVYNDLAEPLAIPGSEGRLESAGPEEQLQQHEVVDGNDPLLSVSLNLRRHASPKTDPHGRVLIPKRYLNFADESALFNFYQIDEPSPQQVSRSTFRKAWGKWSRIMAFKNKGENSKRNICARLTVERAEAVEPSERLRVDAAKRQHLDCVMADRSVSVRCNKLASRADVWLTKQNHSSMCKLMLDGMDQSKFAIPRRKDMSGTSSWSKCWRPSIHVTGCICFGQFEYYAIMRPDQAKDSNMNATITCRVLDLLHTKLQSQGPEYSFPPELVSRFAFSFSF